MRLTKKELRALRLFRDEAPDATTRVHGKTRHALERKGLVRGKQRGGGWILTPAGRAALAPPPGIPDIFADLFPPTTKET